MERREMCRDEYLEWQSWNEMALEECTCPCPLCSSQDVKGEAGVSIKDGLELGQHGFPVYREALQVYSDRRDAWVRAEIQVEVPHEGEAPSLADCRYAALRLHNKGNGYVVYDRLLSRIVDGVYYGDNALANALGVAEWLSEGGKGRGSAPNGEALGLVYPKVKGRHLE